MIRKLKNQKGVTMIELLVAVMIFGMILHIIYAILFMTISVYHRTMSESDMRNRGEAMYSQVVSELEDAIYVKDGSDNQSIIYAKKTEDAEQYLEMYQMTLRADPHNDIVVAKLPEYSVVTEFDLGIKFSIREGEIKSLGNHDRIRLYLIYDLIEDETGVERANVQEMRIDSHIPLFRHD